MAIVNLKDVTVTRLHGKGHGLDVTEENESGGKTYKTRFTLWFKEASNLAVGDVVSVSGFLGAKVGDPWTGNDGQERRSVELSLNSPRIEGSGNASSPVAAETGDSWDTSSDANRPF